jgi:hypothetical protein
MEVGAVSPAVSQPPHAACRPMLVPPETTRSHTAQSHALDPASNRHIKEERQLITCELFEQISKHIGIHAGMLRDVISKTTERA